MKQPKIFIKELNDSFYSQVDPRRRQEISDSRMIQEDDNALANLSPRFIHKEFNPDRFKYDQNSAARPSYNIFNDEVEPVPSRD